MYTQGPPNIPSNLSDLRTDIVGIDTPVPLLDGTEQPYIFLDNAASTPAFKTVLNCIDEFLPWYSGVHRGTGFKSLLSTSAFDGAHDAVLRFVHADPSTNACVFTKNTTECVNKLANRWNFRPGDVVCTSIMEHHSNDLPWRAHAEVIHIGVTPEGHLDLDELHAALRRHAGRIKLVAVNGASNITGLCPPIHTIARWAHDAGARIFVDAAQLAPHRAIDMRPDDDPEHLDFLSFSAHKMYAPFGTGVLVGPTAFFEQGPPDVVGGGVVDVVTLTEAVWNRPPHKEEAGSPNVVGGVALAASIAVLERVGMSAIAAHEQELLEYAYARLRSLPGIQYYGPVNDLTQKVGVVTLNVEGVHHALTAAILSLEGGIGVRNGCFCAHPYVKTLLGVSTEADHRLTAEVISGNRMNMPGMVRASFGCYTTKGDVDALVDMLNRIVRKEYRGRYVQDRTTGAFVAEGFAPRYSRYFSFADLMAPTVSRVASEAS